MLKIYTISSCASCKKAKEWLILHNIEFKEVDLRKSKLTIEEFKHILSLTKVGTEELFSNKNVSYKRFIQKQNINLLTIKELFTEVQKHQGMLKRPIIVNEMNLQIGYNEEDIRKFLPREVRRLEMQKLYSRDSR
jgi:transcriptional regulator, Spx/MgsR family